MGIRKYFTREYAILKDDHGRTVGTKKLKFHEQTFKWKKRTYNILRKNTHRDTIKGLIFTTHRYFYNINNPQPYAMNNTSNTFEPMIDPELYSKLLEAEILIKLNTTPGNWLKNLDWRILLGLVAGLAVLIYFARGGSLT